MHLISLPLAKADRLGRLVRREREKNRREYAICYPLDFFLRKLKILSCETKLQLYDKKWIIKN